MAISGQLEIIERIRKDYIQQNATLGGKQNKPPTSMGVALVLVLCILLTYNVTLLQHEDMVHDEPGIYHAKQVTGGNRCSGK